MLPAEPTERPAASPRSERVQQIVETAFAILDDLADRYGVEKIKTLGDGYLAVAGVPTPRPDHASAAARMAIDVSPALHEAIEADWPGLEVRVGIASGPFVAGVIGRRRFSYDVWGDTVNTASRMESHGMPGEIRITRATYDLIRTAFDCTPQGMIDVKGKGPMEVYRIDGRKKQETPA